MNTKRTTLREVSFALLLAVSATAAWAGNPDKASPAYDAYVERVEARLAQQHKSAETFLWSRDRDQPALLARVHDGSILLEKEAAGMNVPGGLIHHWRATTFLPGATTAELLAVLQNTGHFPAYYKPQVLRAQTLGRDGGLAQVSMRMQYHKLITVTMETRYDVRYAALDPAHGNSSSRSTRIRELEHANTAREKELEPRDDHGFLWRLNSYWSYAQYPDGVLVQCEAVSLTREVPFGLDHIIGPFIFSIPRESLEFTLDRTRQAVLAGRNHGK